MAKKPNTICPDRMCQGVVINGICSSCGKSAKRMKRKEQEKDRASSTERGYGYRWNKIRNIYINSHPFCEKCEEENSVTMAVDVHHIVPIRFGGSNFDENLMAVCRKHHAQLDEQARKKYLGEGG